MTLPCNSILVRTVFLNRSYLSLQTLFMSPIYYLQLPVKTHP
jgi:hypothetical protein